MVSPQEPGSTLTLRRPDDWHVHLRDGALLQAVVAHTARPFARAIVMPNLRPPITTAAMGAAYRQRILTALRQRAGAEAAASAPARCRRAVRIRWR